MALPTRTERGSWGKRLYNEWRGSDVWDSPGRLSKNTMVRETGLKKQDITALFAGAECPDSWYRLVERSLRHHGVVVPLPKDSPRIAPERNLDALNEEERRQIVSDPVYISWIVHELFLGTDGTPFRLQWFHVEILESMFRGGHKVLNLPTDHMKSVCCCFLFPLLSLMNDPNETHIIIGANLEDSKSRLAALQMEIESNEKLAHYYPWVQKPEGKGSWTATWFNVSGRTLNKPNPSVRAASPGASDIKGKRGKLIMDDLEGEKHRTSPREREKLYEWIKLVGYRCYEDTRETPRPLHMICGTPFLPDSVYFKLERENWEVTRYKVTAEDPPPMEKNCVEWDLLWPDKAEKIEDARKMMDTEQFSIAYLMDPSGGDPSMLSEQQIRELLAKGEDVEAGDNVFVALDPASGDLVGESSRRKDYAGISVCAVNWPKDDFLPRVKVLRAYKFTGDFIEQVRYCGALSEEFGGIPCIYERNAMQAGYDSLFQRFAPRVERIGTYTTQNKKLDTRMGLGVLKTMLSAQRILGVGDTPGMHVLAKEIANLGTRFDDHIACSVWFCIRHVYEKTRAQHGPTLRSMYGDWGRGYVGSYGIASRRSPLEAEMEKERERFRSAMGQ